MEIDKDELYWEQRARANWLQLGDRNTTFFHKFASTRRRINTISRLETNDGKEIYDESEIKGAATAYFQNLFSSNGMGNLSHLLSGIDNSITQDINATLLAKYSAEEVYMALKGMGPSKAPGHYDFSVLFFQTFWHILDPDIEDFCLVVLNGGKDFDSLNQTELVLIPKISNPTSLVNFRPISLCTVIYKIVAKTIANRLQEFIGRCIDDAQSALVPANTKTFVQMDLAEYLT
ncbi:hypothetical protein PVK06_039927 [Gossypium arboreum]|uniref:Reverse transcriptase n=1 Tax=Gossypium arboreum TaxID=29729 RepID=A0ABR0N4W0_GOSAR|nr:hypothetical protein PVK06_039927 [Gossypium arboreum]